MNDSLLDAKLARYNSVLDLISQINITLQTTFAPNVILNKIEELQALVYYEMMVMQKDKDCDDRA